MDFWASLEHQLRYKKDGEFTEEIAQELYECAKLSADLDFRMQEVRNKVEKHS
jgi:putative GTP pyrophosphokinase